MRGVKGGGRAWRVGLLACLGLVWATSAIAQSAYACRGLERHSALPAVEGAAGTFFAIRPELQAHHSLSDGSIAFLSDLTRALDARGTVLIFLPVPTRAQVLTDKLPLAARDVGFQVDLSLAVHEDMLRRLRVAGVNVADARPALRAASLAGELPYFETDPRPTGLGVRILAQSVGEIAARLPQLADLPRRRFVTQAGTDVVLPSDMRNALQRACQSPLPEVRTPDFSTSALATTVLSSTSAAPDPVATLVVVGADLTATEPLNLPGFLSEATGFGAQGYGVSKGGAMAAMSSYLTSPDFTARPPDVLVWEWPVAAPMALHGSHPMQELVAAARGACAAQLPLLRSPTGTRVSADLSTLPFRPDITLAFDTGGSAATVARFHVTGADGLVRTRSLYRHSAQVLTGRFFMTLSDLAPEGLLSVEVETDTALGATPRLAACF